MARIQVVIEEAEREEFREHARREGRSLSEWLREAGRQRVAATRPRRLESREDLEGFFAAIDRLHAGEPREEDWPNQKERIGRSRVRGLPDV